MRETVTVPVPEFPGTRNRDKGKLFRITEWPAQKAEEWGLRMIFALNSGQSELPTNIAGIGMEGIAIIGINAFLRAPVDPGVMIPLLDELLGCVKMVRDPGHPEVATDVSNPDDIEEVATRMWLRGEVLSLHLGFSVSAALSALYRRIMISSPATDQDPSKPRTSP